MTTINNIDDLVRILRERPEWLNAIRELVLTEELLRLPETVAKLAEELREFARQTNERLERLEADVAELKSDMAEVKADVAELKSDMAEVKADVAELKSDMIEVKADVAELKSDMIEVKADVAELKSDVAELKSDVAELKSDMTEVKSGQAQTNRRLGRVENQINDLRGDTFEITAARRIFPELFRQVSIYNCDIVLGPGMSITREMLNDIRRAQADDIIELNSEHEIAYADLVLRGLHGDAAQSVWVVVEASVKIDEHDIARARKRADILAAVYREQVLAIVAGESIDERDQARADDADVRVIVLRPRYRTEE